MRANPWTTTISAIRLGVADPGPLRLHLKNKSTRKSGIFPGYYQSTTASGEPEAVAVGVCE
ncbi:MAG TPA: hypothetical protein PKD72_08720 [Gemmatales bacterium]|nr:hypothetical protein [Gemmatales bacterium]